MFYGLLSIRAALYTNKDERELHMHAQHMGGRKVTFTADSSTDKNFIGWSASW